MDEFKFCPKVLKYFSGGYLCRLNVEGLATTLNVKVGFQHLSIFLVFLTSSIWPSYICCSDFGNLKNK